MVLSHINAITPILTARVKNTIRTINIVAGIIFSLNVSPPQGSKKFAVSVSELRFLPPVKFSTFFWGYIGFFYRLYIYRIVPPILRATLPPILRAVCPQYYVDNFVMVRFIHNTESQFSQYNYMVTYL